MIENKAVHGFNGHKKTEDIVITLSKTNPNKISIVTAQPQRNKKLGETR